MADIARPRTPTSDDDLMGSGELHAAKRAAEADAVAAAAAAASQLRTMSPPPSPPSPVKPFSRSKALHLAVSRRIAALNSDRTRSRSAILAALLNDTGDWSDVDAPGCMTPIDAPMPAQNPPESTLTRPSCLKRASSGPRHERTVRFAEPIVQVVHQLADITEDRRNPYLRIRERKGHQRRQATNSQQSSEQSAGAQAFADEATDAIDATETAAADDAIAPIEHSSPASDTAAAVADAAPVVECDQIATDEATADADSVDAAASSPAGTADVPAAIDAPVADAMQVDTLTSADSTTTASSSSDALAIASSSDARAASPLPSPSPSPAAEPVQSYLSRLVNAIKELARATDLVSTDAPSRAVAAPPPSPAIVIEIPPRGESAIYEVERILGERVVNGKRQYLIKWAHFSWKWNTWEPLENLHCPELLSAFERAPVARSRRRAASMDEAADEQADMSPTASKRRRKL